MTKPDQLPEDEAPRIKPKDLLRIAGFPAVKALFETMPQRVERLFFDQRMTTRIGAFCAQLARARKPYRRVKPDELEKISGSVMHGGVVALARPRPVPVLDPTEIANWALDGQPLLLLDGIGNPHNLGGIARTAAFFGLPRMVLSDHPAQAGPSDASYRIAEGGLEYLDLYRGAPFVPTLQQLRQSYRVIGSATEGGRPLREVRSGDRPIALVLGNEERGLSRETLDACEDIVTISGAGHVQSLNVAATAAIFLQALAKPKAERFAKRHRPNPVPPREPPKPEAPRPRLGLRGRVDAPTR
ncbi:MAG: RNA methyltransferase [Rhodospirillales bacterium]|nr:RNA methyltransferase [Rhodospirillales bacterium]